MDFDQEKSNIKQEVNITSHSEKMMAMRDTNPSILANIAKDEPLICSSCIHGKTTHKPWREKVHKTSVQPA